MAFSFPAWLDAHLVADPAFGAAYDSLTQQERACVKTGIARMAAVEENLHPPVEHSHRIMRQGFSLHAYVRPCDWTVVMWDCAYAGPSRILAALLPAMVAGVPNILACCVTEDGTSATDPVLAALELAGQELAAVLPPDGALTLAAHCCETGASARANGRLILLGANAVFDNAAAIAADADTPCRRMAAPTRIGVAASSFANHVPDKYLAFMHPDASLVPFDGEAVEAGFSALFCRPDRVAGYLGKAPLVLSPGNEGFWRWPGIDAAFFRETGLGIFDAGTGGDLN